MGYGCYKCLCKSLKIYKLLVNPLLCQFFPTVLLCEGSKQSGNLFVSGALVILGCFIRVSSDCSLMVLIRKITN